MSNGGKILALQPSLALCNAKNNCKLCLNFFLPLPVVVT